MAQEDAPKTSTTSQLDQDTLSETWHIHSSELPSGPYPLKKVQALLDEGKILPSTRLTHSKDSEKTITVMDLLKSHTDPAYGLMDLLLAARDRKAHNRAEMLETMKGVDEGSRLPFPPWAWKIAAALIATGIVLAGVQYFMDGATSSGENKSRRGQSTQKE